MIVTFDTCILLYLLDPTHVPLPPDPNTNQPIDRPLERLNFLIETLDSRRDVILIPTPSWAELLLHPGDAADKWFAETQKNSSIRFANFDMRAAYEAAQIERTAIGKDARHNRSKQCIKFDRQILAIAKVSGVDTIYSLDNGFCADAKRNNMNITKLHEMPLPPTPPEQIDWIQNNNL